MKERYNFSKKRKNSIIKPLKHIINQGFEVVFPSRLYCICCNSIIDNFNRYGLCKNCFHKMRWNNERSCLICDRPLRENYTLKICKDCSLEERVFTKGYTATGYGLLERYLVLNFKKGNKSYLCHNLGEILSDRLIEEDFIKDVDFITFVPISKEKLIKRGYNQSRLMAKKLGSLLEIKVVDILLKNKDTKELKHLDSFQRKIKIRNTIALRRGKKVRIVGKNILIIDDVFTTGATLEECSRILLEAGVNQVYVATFSAAW